MYFHPGRFITTSLVWPNHGGINGIPLQFSRRSWSIHLPYFCATAFSQVELLSFLDKTLPRKLLFPMLSTWNEYIETREDDGNWSREPFESVKISCYIIIKNGKRN